MTEGYQGCIFLHSSCPRVAGEKGRGRRKKRKESKRLNLAIFLICAFLVALPIYAAVLTNYSYLFSHCHIAGKIMGQTEQI